MKNIISLLRLIHEMTKIYETIIKRKKIKDKKFIML